MFPKRRSRRTWLILIAIVVAASIVLPFMLGGGSADLGKPLLQEVERGSIENSVDARGKVQPLRVVSVGARVTGELEALHVQVGDQVEQGMVLAELSSEEQEQVIQATSAQLRGLEGQLPALEAQLRLAESELRREEQLMQANATAEAQLDRAVASLASSRASLEQHRQSIEQARALLAKEETRLRYTQIAAPISGEVSKVLVEVGQTLNAAQQTPIILEIAEASRMRVRALVSEADIGSLSEGVRVDFSAPGLPGRRWQSSIEKVLRAPEVRSGINYYPVLFTVDNEDRALFTNMSVDVEFSLNSANDVLMVPMAALTIPSEPRHESASAAYMRINLPKLAEVAPSPFDVDTPGTRAITYVAKDTGEITRREIRIGARNLVAAEVIEGLKEGEKVVTGSLVDYSQASISLRAS